MSGEITNSLIISIEGKDVVMTLEEANVEFDQTESEILTIIAPRIKEGFDVDIIDDEDGTNLYKINKSIESKNIHLIPQSTAGIL